MLVDEWKRHDMIPTLQICLNCLSERSQPVPMLTYNEPTSTSSSSSTSSISYEQSSSSNHQPEQAPVQEVHDVPISESVNEYEESKERFPASILVTSSTDNDVVKPELPSLIIGCINSGNFKELREKLKNIEDVTLLQIVDIGGQPEFHEIFPLLLNGSALYLLFLNVTKDIKEPFTCTYRHKCEDNSFSPEYEYTSQFTTLQVLHQILSCIDSYENHSVAMLIGTYLDKFKKNDCTDDVRKEVQDSVGKSLTESMKNTSYYRNDRLITYANNAILYPVSNVSGTFADEIKPLREIIKKALGRMKITKSLPTSWALFYFLLRDFPNRNGGKAYCTLEEAKSFAKKLCMKSKNVERALKYIHQHFSNVLYYDDVSDNLGKKYIFCHADAILKPITHLVAICLGSNKDYAITAKNLRETGLIQVPKFNELCRKGFQDSLFYGYVVRLLQKRLIITDEICIGDCKKYYFVPSLLHIKSKEEKDDPPIPTVAPLLFTFSIGNDFVGYVPPGLFSALLVKLVTTTNWTLKRVKKRCRGEVAFMFAETVLKLVAQPHCLEVRILSDPSAPNVCSEIRNIIKQNFKEIKCNVLEHYLRRVLIEEAFYCPSCQEPVKVMIDAKILDCTCSNKPINLEQEHAIWFSGKSTVSSFNSSCLLYFFLVPLNFLSIIYF